VQELHLGGREDAVEGPGHALGDGERACRGQAPGQLVEIDAAVVEEEAQVPADPVPEVDGDGRPASEVRVRRYERGNPPGSNCLDGCAFDLCPYPPKGLPSHRAELSEAFCRHQYMLVRRSRIGRGTARWQGLWAGQMRTFWSEMANRSRSGPAGR
jgi:hypothetical protein